MTEPIAPHQTIEPATEAADRRKRTVRRRAKPFGPNGALVIPEAWPVLPASGPLEADADWVYANLALCRQRCGARGKAIVRLEWATSPAPSKGALTLMDAAINKPDKFTLDTYVRIKAKPKQGEGEPDSEEMQHDQAAIAEIEKMLARLQANVQKRNL